MGGTCSTHMADDKCYAFMSLKPKVINHSRSKRRLEDNVKNILKIIESEDMEWFETIGASCCRYGYELLGFIKLEEFW